MLSPESATRKQLYSDARLILILRPQHYGLLVRSFTFSRPCEYEATSYKYSQHIPIPLNEAECENSSIRTSMNPYEDGGCRVNKSILENPRSLFILTLLFEVHILNTKDRNHRCMYLLALDSHCSS